MKSNLLMKLGLVGAMATSFIACSKDSGGGGGGGGQPAGPVSPYNIYGSDVYDNSYGQPRFSIRRDSIVNTSMVLRDLSDTRTNYVNQITLQFDSQGQLSAVGTIDIAAFDHHRNNMGFGGSGYYNNGGDRFGGGASVSLSGMPQGPVARPQGQLVSFRGVNIGYDFNSRTGKIIIDRFFMSSPITTNQLGRQGRLAITVGVLREKTTRVFGRYPLRAAAYKFEIPGRLIDMSDEHVLSPQEVQNLSQIQSHGRVIGIDIGSQIRGGAVEIAAGDIIAGEGTQYNYQNQYTYQYPNNGSQPQTQPTYTQQPVQIPVFVRDGSKSSFLYLDAVLDPRGFRPY